MTLPIREQVLAAFKTKVATITGVTGLAIERNRDAPVQSFPMLIIVDGDMNADDSDSAMTKYFMDATVEGWIRSTTDNIGEDLNTLYAKLVEVVLNDRTLGSLCFDISEQSSSFEIDRSDGKSPVGCFSTTFQIQFFTKQGDPFTLAP